MTRRGFALLLVLTIVVLFAVVGCGRDTNTLSPASYPVDPVVFIDDFGPGVQYHAFQWSDVEALDVDWNFGYQSDASLVVSVPDASAPDGGFAGGAFVAGTPRDFTSFNALTFYAKASRPEIFDVVGLANDNTGNSKYQAARNNIELTTSWKKYIIPIPRPARLGAEGGLFFYADAVPEDSSGYTVWFDDVIFEHVAGISNPRPTMSTETVKSFIGATIEAHDTEVTFDVDDESVIVEHYPGYFTYVSSNDSVVVIDGEEIIRVVGAGDATITASLDEVVVDGTVTLDAEGAPATAAPTPTVPAADVISLFSHVYDDRPVETWAATWTGASHDVADFDIEGNTTKVYSNLNWAGVVLEETIDISEMTHFHMDVWVAEGLYMRIKLIDFGADGVFGGAPDVEHELTFHADSSPPFYAGEWVSLEIPMEDFVRLTTREHLAQFIISAQNNTVFIDNVYWHK